MTYPSGRVVSYGRDAVGRINTATSTKNGIQKPVVSAANYEPFGPVSQVTFGNGAAFDYSRRTDYRVSDIDSVGITNVDHTYDNAGSLIERQDVVEPAFDKIFEYDGLDRLKSTTYPNGSVTDYAAAVLADSPVLYWRFEETTGNTATDTSGNGNSGTLMGNASLASTGLVGGSTSAVRMDPPDAAHVESQSLTGVSVTGIEGWFEIESAPSVRNLFVLWNSAAARTGITATTDGRIQVYRYKHFYMTSDNPVSLNEPHHIALWYDASTNETKFMIDGVTQQDTRSSNLLNIPNPILYVGASRWHSLPVDQRHHGSVDEIAVYNTPVNAQMFQSHFTGIGAKNTFSYDSNGNRQSLNNAATIEDYTYTPASNRLANISGQSIQRDASGNRLSDQGGSRTFSYSDTNRLESVTVGGTSVATYVHNGLGQRVQKTTAAGTSVYLYDLEGHIIAEHDAAGGFIKDYVWIEDVPVAQVDAGETFTYLHVDHLGTPRLATDDSQTVVWRWDSDAFGSTAANEDPDGDSIATVVNLRFPGQYFDAESGFHYNYYRTYDPSVGRYLESDPIGLTGGLNSYSYVSGNPLSSSDSFGLADTMTTRMTALAARGDLNSLRNLYQSGALTPSQQAFARRAVLNLKNNVHGAKSASELAKHIKNLEKYRDELTDLQNALKTTRRKKAKDSLKQKIDDLVRQNKGHEKEIWQKWPDVAEYFCPK